MSSISPEVKDILIRSRITLLNILEENGYITDPYKNITPSQILTLAEGNENALSMVFKRNEESDAPCKRAVALFMIKSSIRLKISTFMRDLFVDEEKEGFPTKKDDIVIILNEPYHEIFEKTALQMWQSESIRVRFFHIKHLVVNPSKHDLVPPHRKLTKDEANIQLERLRIVSKSQLPLIKHSDIQARILGAVPGDLIEVLRPSTTAGITRVIRVCVA